MLPFEDEALNRPGCEVAVPMGVAVGTSVEDFLTIREMPCTGSRSIPMTSGLLGNMVLTFLVGLSPSGCAPSSLRPQLVFGVQALVGVPRPQVGRGFGLVVVVGELLFRA